MANEKKDWENMKTSELLDAAETENFEEFYDGAGGSEELYRRAPFENLQEEINELTEKLEGMQKAIDKLKRHQHGNNGEVLAPF